MAIVRAFFACRPRGPELVVIPEREDAIAALNKEGRLILDDEARLFVHEISRAGVSQLAVVGCVPVPLSFPTPGSEPSSPSIDAIARRIKTIGAHDEPVLMSYPRAEEIDEMIATAVAEPGERDFEAGGDRHRVWMLDHKTTRVINARFSYMTPRDDGIELSLVGDQAAFIAAARVRRELRGARGEDAVCLAWIVASDRPGDSDSAIVPPRGLFAHPF